MTKRAKNSKTARKKSAAKSRPVPRKLTVLRGLQLDRQAVEYAQLLKDPCNGPLVHSTFAGSGGSLITRFEYDFIANTGATETCSMGYFAPNFIVNSNTFNSLGFAPAATPLTSDGVTAQLGNNLAGQQPGQAFLLANASAYRAISACIQVSWPGTELNRGGIIGLGQSTLGQFTSTLTAPSYLRALSSHVERTPDGVLEIRMVPNQQSESWLGPGWGSAPEGGMQDMPALFWTAAGLTAGVGLRVRCVVVVEWKPKQAIGMMVNNADQVANVSSNTTNNVLKYMYRFGEWAVSSPTVQRVARQGADRLLSGIAGYASRAMLTM